MLQRHTIMNKFRRFLGRISAETCVKMDYLVVNPKKSPSADQRMCIVQDATPIEITG